MNRHGRHVHLFAVPIVLLKFQGVHNSADHKENEFSKYEGDEHYIFHEVQL